VRRLPLLVAVALLGCAEEPSTTPETSAEATLESPLLDGVTWGLDWDLGDAEYTDAGWSITNDLGFTFVLEAGWLIDYALTMVPCEDTVADAGWERLLGIRTAHAGHEYFDDPSEITPQHPEALDALGYAALSELSFEPATYCHVHWLVAKADEGTVAPDGTDLSGVALQLTARWEGAETSGALNLSTEWTNGVLLDFGVSEGTLADEAVHGEVTVVRSLGGLFDGIDPTLHTELEIAWALLSNLVEQAEVRFAVGARALRQNTDGPGGN